MHLRQLFPLFGLLTTAVSLSSPSFQGKCAALAGKIDLDQPFTINIAEYLPPNAIIDYETEGLNETCLASGNVAYPIPVGVCRLNLRVETTNSSEVYVEVWLPENWEGRLLTTGNGGLAGCIQYYDLAYGASYGFATFGTNSGHNGTSGGAFYQQPEVFEDFVWRAVYTGAHVGKSLTQQFYGDDCGKSYFLGCSTGGRQGMKAVQKNPELFDGVIAGAPALEMFVQISWWANALKILGPNQNDTLISLEQWSAVEEEVLNQCDALDGASDGILEDPAMCKFDWTPLVCPDNFNPSSTCLDPAQVEGAVQLFAPLTYNSSTLHPGHFHGYEEELVSFLYGPYASAWVPEGFRYILYSDPTWDPATFTLEDAYNALHLNPSNANTFDSDISAFRDRGGKLLHWHGGADPVLASSISNLYYENVQSTMNASVAELDTFYRYFRVSGVGHCAGGPGASALGQGKSGDTGSSDPDDNVLLRIVDWVEKGAAPEFIRGTKYVNDMPALGVEFKRKHCKYPLVNTYKGAWNGIDEQGWKCVEAAV